MFQRVCIMGVGLLGGSIGMALRARKLAREVVGHGRSAERLQKAIELGAIDIGYCDIADAARHADLIVACGPVQEIAKQLASASPFMLPTGVMTDVGSTKETILDEVHRLGSRNRSLDRIRWQAVTERESSTHQPNCSKVASSLLRQVRL